MADAASAKHQSSEEPNNPSSSTSRKRKRKTYSCVDCRRRKLKCDREHPCGRCIKEGHPQSCTFRNDGHNSETEEYDGVYQPYPVLEIERPGRGATTSSEKKTATPNGSFVSDQTVVLQRRIASLESKLAKYESVSCHQDATVPARIEERETRFFKGHSFRTQFYGQTNPTSMFAHFPEVISMAKEKENRYRTSSSTRVPKDLVIMRSRRKERKQADQAAPSTELVSLLPSKDTMDYLSQLYFNTYETTLRIIHKPSFWTEYNSAPCAQWREPFIAIVLLILATVNCAAVSELSFKDDVSTARVKAQQWVTAVDSWWNRQSQKHLTIETFQVGILLLLSKATNALKRKRAWANSGFLLRIAISAGFQREPNDLSGRISVFDAEMRRRLWATIFEWDLVVSISRGIPPMAASVPSDCRAPLNINDTELEKDSQHLPDALPLSERTDSSFLQISLQSLSLRTSLASLLNDPNVQFTWSEVLSYEERIQRELESLPDWAQDKTSLTAVLLDLQLRQFMLWIFASHARGKSGSRTAYARMATVTAATEMIDLYSKLGAGEVNALNMLRYDMYHCIVAISLNLLAETKNALMSNALYNNIRSTCEKGFIFLEDKVLKVGEGYNHMWFASASYAIAQVALNPSIGEARLIAIERVVKLYYKVLAYQETTTMTTNSGDLASNGNRSTDSNNLSTNSITKGTPAAAAGGAGLISPGSWHISPSAGTLPTTSNAYIDGLLAKDTIEGMKFVDMPDLPGWMDDDFFAFDTSFM